jgi:membrane fusion protein, adhesin transport system
VASPFARTTRSLAGDSPRGAFIMLGVAGIVLLVWLIWFLASGVTLYEVSQSARFEVGTSPRDVAPTQSGRLVTTRVAIGRHVRAGDVLIELDAGTQRLRLADAERRLGDYPVRLASLAREGSLLAAANSAERTGADAATRSARARAAEADTAARFSADVARRQLADSEAGGIARADAMRAAADARRAAATRDSMTEDARRLAAEAQTSRGRNAARIEELERTRLALRDEQAATAARVAQLRVEIGNRVVRAPVSGVVAEVQAIPPGSVVAAGQRLATIVPSGDLIVVAEFDPATALGRIRPGQRATLRLAGYPWAEYGTVKARVERVAGELREGKMRVELSATRRSVRGVTLAHGLAGTVEVAVERVSPARLLLRSVGQVLR